MRHVIQNHVAVDVGEDDLEGLLWYLRRKAYLNSAATVSFDVFPGVFDAPIVHVYRNDFLRATFFRKDGENARAGTEIENGLRLKSNSRIACIIKKVVA